MWGKAKISRESEFSSLLPGLQWHKWLCSVTSFPHISNHKLLIFPLLISLCLILWQSTVLVEDRFSTLTFLILGGLWSLCCGKLFCAPSRVFSRILRFKEHSLPLSCSCDNLWQIPVSSPSKVVPTWEFQMRGRKEKDKILYSLLLSKKRL